MRRVTRSLEGKYGFVLIAIFATLIVVGAVSDFRAGAIVIPVLFLGLLFLTMLASGVRRRTIVFLTTIVPVVQAVGAGSTASEWGSRGLSSLVGRLQFRRRTPPAEVPGGEAGPPEAPGRVSE